MLPTFPTFPSTDDELTDDALTARVRVLQRRHGHRYSLDDVLTAWLALTFRDSEVDAVGRATPRTCLDLGCGLGSVLLMLADKLPGAQLWGVEAQEVSHALAVRNIERNGLAARVRAVRGDLRDAELLAALRAEACAHGTQGFQLVTGTPPYKPLGTATPSPDSQRAHARVELRGGVEEYVLAASRVLAPGGKLVVCAEAGADARVEAGAERAGLLRVARMDAVPMAGRKGRLFAVHVLVPPPSAAAFRVLPAFIARDADGARTAASHELRQFFGLSIAADEAPSPPLRARLAGPMP